MINLLVIDITAVIISGIGAIVSLGTVALTLLVKKRVDTVSKNIDGKMTQLLEATGQAKKAEGKEEGRSERQDEIDTTIKKTVDEIKKT